MKDSIRLDDPVLAPEIQDMIMSNRIGIIASEVAKRLGVMPTEALEMFYASRTCADLHDKSTGLYTAISISPTSLCGRWGWRMNCSISKSWNNVL